YLSVLRLDIGLPKYRVVDRALFYLWDYVYHDPQSYGLILLTKRRNGTGFGLNTPIRMLDGSVKLVQDVQEGDLVMRNDSAPRRAYGITKGREAMYRIVPNFGEPFTCNESHVLSLKYNGSYSPKNGWCKD